LKRTHPKKAMKLQMSFKLWIISSHHIQKKLSSFVWTNIPPTFRSITLVCFLQGHYNDFTKLSPWGDERHDQCSSAFACSDNSLLIVTLTSIHSKSITLQIIEKLVWRRHDEKMKRNDKVVFHEHTWRLVARS
jgi:hypothetical protein